MFITMLKSKIHRAVVTEANLDYVGSITIDEELMDAVGLHEYEMVHVVDINNGNRFETYVIPGPRTKGDICLNGAAARLAYVGDTVIIMSFCQIDDQKLSQHSPQIVFVDERNAIEQIRHCEVHGEIK